MGPRRRLIWFRRVALAGAGLAAAVVVLGAWVRLTNAGLGCPDWPGCYGHVYPNTGLVPAASALSFAKALHEMIHRYVATSLGIVIVILAVWALRFRHERDQPVIPAVLAFVVVCLQGALGALTVTLLLRPLIVTAHLLGGLTTFGLLCWLSLPPGTRLTAQDYSLRRYARVGLAVLILQIALGGWTSTNYAAAACPDLPTCQRSWWPAMDFRDAFVLWRGLDIDYEGGVLANAARTAIHVSHRLGAVAAGLILTGLGVLTIARARSPRLKRAGAWLLLAVAMQISIGLSTVHWGVPLGLATLHNAGAAFLVVCMVNLLRALSPPRGGPPGSPAGAIGMVPLPRVDSAR